MTELRQAAQMALEALEWSWGGEPIGTIERDAIIALRAALAEPEYPQGQASTDVGVPVYVLKKAEPEHQSKSQDHTKVNFAECPHGADGACKECYEDEQGDEMSEQPEALRLAITFEEVCGPNDVSAELRRLYAENEALRDELAEQARLNGMGSEREARLMAVNTELLEALKHAAECVRTNYLPDQCGRDWDDVIAKAEASK